jgi:regulator of PEP synthase PpsR (kinase-PPPase family)
LLFRKKEGKIAEMKPHSRKVYYISGATGLLAEDLGRALLSQFPDQHFETKSFAFILTEEEAEAAREKILAACCKEEEKPIVFSSLLRPELARHFISNDFILMPLYDQFLPMLEEILDDKAVRRHGLARTQDDNKIAHRVDAIHYSISHDDGAAPSDYDAAELIILGVSRAGKTPVSIFLATKMELKTANYPLVPQDLEQNSLSDNIVHNLQKVVGLTISPKILHRFRKKRFANSSYASYKTCEKEVEQARKIFEKYSIPVVESSGSSIEETAMQVYLEFKARN